RPTGGAVELASCCMATVHLRGVGGSVSNPRMVACVASIPLDAAAQLPGRVLNSQPLAGAGALNRFRGRPRFRGACGSSLDVAGSSSIVRNSISSSIPAPPHAGHPRRMPGLYATTAELAAPLYAKKVMPFCVVDAL